MEVGGMARSGPDEGRVSVTSTTVLLVRHGATAANVCRPHLLQGRRPDSELIDLGKEQAGAVARALRRFPVVRVYMSPLKRARQTATIIADHLEVETVVEEGLIEADVGEWSGLSWPEVERRWPEEYRAFGEDAEREGYLGGENMGQVRDRVWKVLDRLGEGHEREVVAVVAHGVVNRVVLAEAMRLPLRYARRIPQDNGAYNTLELRNGKVEVKTVNAKA
jgi:broad specificity phosphatase PhoE